MKYNNNVNQDTFFTLNSIVKVPRTTFNRNQKLLTTFNAGDLVPLYLDEVIPGDTYELDLSSVVRFNSPLVRAPMDDVEMNVWLFFVPKRLCEKQWQNLISNYRDNPDWTSDVNLSMSAITIPSGGFAIDSVADHFNIPVQTGSGVNIVAAPFRAYGLIWDNWFRDENLQNSIVVDTDYSIKTGVNNITGSYITDAVLGGRMCPLNKIHDYFTSALPAPQEGGPSIIGIGATAPVYGNGYGLSLERRTSVISEASTLGMSTSTNNHLTPYTLNANSKINEFSNLLTNASNFTDKSPVNIISKNLSTINNVNSNVYADLSAATAISVNDLRLAVQSQLIKECDARYGNRYKEFLLGHFGVISADARLQIPEYLGSTSFILQTQQVPQTSGTTSNSPQANIGAYGLTNDKSALFVKSFTEHGYIIAVGGVRVKNRTYPQGLNKLWNRFTRFDNYFPELAHIGEQPILNQEIYLSANDTQNKEVFGYQEAWADYRYLPNQASGYMRPNISGTLAQWNYADNYNTLPTLSGEWMREDKVNIDRVLAVSSSQTPQFLADLYFTNKITRPMPLHSVPGLIDHTGKIIL